MIAYASNTGTLRNLAALRAAGWGILLTPSNPRRREGIRFAVDNGAWTAFQQGFSFDEVGFLRVLEPNALEADFVVVPDIVAAGVASLSFSLSWLPRLAHVPRPLLAVQNGMLPGDIVPLLHRWPRLGIFLGGDTEWKLATMHEWGELAASFSRHYHVGRVNSARRIRLCEEAGADSFDGTSVTRYACTLPLLESARQNQSLFRPRK